MSFLMWFLQECPRCKIVTVWVYVKALPEGWHKYACNECGLGHMRPG